jgi:hypothetical protein
VPLSEVDEVLVQAGHSLGIRRDAAADRDHRPVVGLK